MTNNPNGTRQVKGNKLKGKYRIFYFEELRTRAEWLLFKKMQSTPAKVVYDN
ncbi:MAG: hypothetical protein ABSE39_11250 [Candidatus Bathyarchaeia archaeon]|jgi:hypothetical protein